VGVERWFLDGPQTADGAIDLDQFAGQRPKRRNSATSASALRTAAEEARFWVAVLPPIFWVS